MARLLFITQAYDPESTILGVTREWVQALAARCDGVDVIALAAPEQGVLAGGRVRVASLGKERGAGRAAQLAAFYGALARWLPGASAVFVHMVPRYVVLAAPLALAARRPLALWYAQGGVDRWLRLGARLSQLILTPTRESFPLSGPTVDRRVVVTGHGINTERYCPPWHGADAGAGDQSATRISGAAQAGRLLAVGRLSPSKRYEVLLEAVAGLAGREWRLRIAGPPLYESDRRYEAALREQVRALGEGERVAFLGDVPYERMPAEYGAAWALAHTSGTGSLDKVVLEAMACGTPVISSAPSSRAVVTPVEPSLWVASQDASAMRAALNAALGWSVTRRADLGAALRQEVARHHSLSGWADQVVALLVKRV